MPRIFRTRAARCDFDGIWDYIKQQSPEAADRMLLLLDATLAKLAHQPMLGRRVEEIAPNLRIFPVGSYLIFYRPVKSGIQLIRTIHGAREIPPEYFDPVAD